MRLAVQYFYFWTGGAIAQPRQLVGRPTGIDARPSFFTGIDARPVAFSGIDAAVTGLLAGIDARPGPFAGGLDLSWTVKNPTGIDAAVAFTSGIDARPAFPTGIDARPPSVSTGIDDV